MPTMKPISTVEMTSLRTDAAALACDTSCAIKRKTSTSDGYGTATESFSTVSDNGLKVGLKSPTARDLQAYADIIGSLKAWIVHFPYGTDVRTQDHLVMGSDTLVVQANVSLSSYSSMTSVLAVEVS